MTGARPGADGAGGDELGRSIARVVDRFADAVRRAARSRGLGDMDTDEVMQDVRVRLWRSRTGGDAESGGVGAGETVEALGPSYIYRVAMTAAIDLLRRRRLERESSLDDLEERAVSHAAMQVEPTDTAAQSDLGAQVQRALATLAVNRRIVVQLHLEGYQRHEIATLTGWTEAKVRNLLYRGMDELRERLREGGVS